MLTICVSTNFHTTSEKNNFDRCVQTQTADVQCLPVSEVLPSQCDNMLWEAELSVTESIMFNSVRTLLVHIHLGTMELFQDASFFQTNHNTFTCQ